MLTYCANIHPGESWGEAFGSLRRHVPEVRRRVSPGAPFPLGLRLSAAAASQVGERESTEFLRWCGENGCFAATVNGFPYGPFHGAPVKKGAYFPSWCTPQRLEYTRRLADLLSAWLPEEVEGSISTVPLACRGGAGAEHWPLLRGNVLRAAEHLRRLREETGRSIVLAFEPEPGCLLETCDDALRFIGLLDLPARLTPFVGVCLDACHEAVQFRDPASSLRRLRDAGVPVGKIQLSAAPAAACAEDAARFSDGVYQHQTFVSRGDGPLLRYPDLPRALDAAPEGEWRIHYHLPLASEVPGTAASLPELIREAKGVLLEAETYTWEVLPPGLRRGSVTDCIVSDLQWARGFL